MMIDVLRTLLCTWEAKWAERPPKVMKRSKKNETTFRYAHAEIRTHVVATYDPTRYPLGQGCALREVFVGVWVRG